VRPRLVHEALGANAAECCTRDRGVFRTAGGDLECENAKRMMLVLMDGMMKYKSVNSSDVELGFFDKDSLDLQEIES